MNSSLSVLKIAVSSACNKQCIALIKGSSIQCCCRWNTSSSMKKIKSNTEEGAPWRMPEWVRNASDALAADPMIHDVKQYIRLRACNMQFPIPRSISFLRRRWRDTLSKAFSRSKNPIYRVVPVHLAIAVSKRIVNNGRMVDFPFWKGSEANPRPDSQL